jgi:glycosyltransferase involved in cell wall biosynthesis
MNLALFFTRAVSLKTWVDTGLFEREKQIYEAHLEAGNFQTVYWLTYGSEDKQIAHTLKEQGKLHPSIFICPMPRIFNIPKLGSWFYSFFLPLVHHKALQKSHYLKTNQMDGSWSAVLAKWFYKKPLVVRTGYTLSQLENQLKRYSVITRKTIELIEKFAYKFADIAVVASQHNKDYLIKKYQIKAEKIQVIGNYIDIQIFFPDTSIKKEPNKIIFVGRLSAEKNLYNLIDAITKTNLVLDIYGQGPLRKKLESYAIKKKSKVNFMGVVANSELPQILNRYQYYILPSFYEGMPKTLLEAMACGLVCIGTDVTGINEVIEDGVNGYLTKGTDYIEIVKTMLKISQSTNNLITIKSRVLIETQYSLFAHLTKEQEVFKILN